MEFRVLGPLEVWSGDARISLKGEQQQLVLALLLADAGQTVSTDSLVDEIWGETPPASARKAVQAYAAQLRSEINISGEVLMGRDGGYVIELGLGTLDSAVFEREAAAGRAAALDQEPAAAGEQLRGALSLWRGTAYVGLVDNSPRLQTEAARLEELRLVALEARVRADLTIGDPAGLVPELEKLISQHPVRERLRALLIVALYRCGRQADALAAYNDTRLVLAEEIGIEPSAELKRLEQRILAQDQVLDTADPLHVGGTERNVERRNPYKGLRAFEETDASDFFGRRELVDRVIERLRRRDQSGRFVALAGPSGSGKSSVVRAGIIPLLRWGAIDTFVDVPVVSMYPGQDPMTALETALIDAGIPGSLSDQALVLIIDQFEELFTLSDEAGRDAFLSAVIDAVDRPGGAVRVVITIRADFLDRALLYPELARLLDEGLELVPPLAEHEVKAAIIEPAQRVGSSVEPTLVAEMVRAVASRPASLPLLQYALTDLFDRASGEAMGLADYQATGGILGALSLRAEDLYSSMSGADQEATRQVYLRLVTIGEETRRLRRRVTRAELAELQLSSDSLSRVLSRYGEVRLLTFDRDHTSGEATVEVPHEALLHEWPRLSDWIEKSRSALISRRRLTTATAEWVAADRDTSYVARGPQLAEYEGLASGSTVSLTETETDYVEAGRAVVNAEMRSRTRRRRLLVSILAAAAAVSLLFAGFALVQKREADEQTRSATARELAAAAVANITADPERSILLALEAIDLTRSVDGTVLREAEEALQQALQGSRLVFTFDAGPGVAFNSSGDLLATTTPEGSVKLWDTTTGELTNELVSSASVPAAGDWPLVDVTFSSDGTRIAAAAGLFDNNGYATTTWDALTEVEVSVVIGHTTNISSASLSPDGSLLATSSLDASVRLWDVAAGASIGVLEHREQALSASFSPDGSRLVVAAGATLHVWDVGSQTKLLELSGHDALVLSVEFLPDGDQVVSASLDGTVRIWDLDAGATVAVLHHPAAVRVASASPDGNTVVTGAEDGVIRLWDVGTRTEILALAGHTTPINQLSFNVAGTLLASGTGLDSIARAGEGGSVSMEVRVWDVGVRQRRLPLTVPARDSATVRAELARLRLREGRVGGDPGGRTGQLADVELSPDGQQMAVSSPEGKVTLWDAETGEELVILDGHDEPVSGIAYSPDGQQLATVAADGARIWDPLTGDLLSGLLENDMPIRLQLGWYSDIEFSPDGRLIAVSRANQTLTFLDAESWRVVEVRNLTGAATEIEYSPDGTTIAAGSNRSAALMISVDGGEDAFIHGERVKNVAYSPDGTLLATASADGKATIWDLTSDVRGGTPLYTITAERLTFNAITFSPSGDSFATGGDDGTVRIWSARDGSPQLTLQAHDGPVIELSYGPDGTRLASVSADGTAKLLVLDIDTLMAMARSRLTRPFTEAECRQYLRVEPCEAA